MTLKFSNSAAEMREMDQRIIFMTKVVTSNLFWKQLSFSALEGRSRYALYILVHYDFYLTGSENAA